MARGVVQEFKSSLAFNGSTSSVSTTTSIASTSTATLAVWVKRTGTLGTGLSRLITFGTGFDIEVGSVAGSGSVAAGIIAAGNSGGRSNTGVLLPLGIWTHVAVTFTSTTYILYVNGVSVNNGTFSASTSSGVIKIGSNGSGEGIVGLLAQAVAWNTVLTAAQITALYNNGIIPTSGLLGLWTLGEGAGTSTVDSSGLANNGTITAATYSADTPSTKRTLVGANLVKNGDFEYAPPFTAAQTVTSRYIDGTASGSTTNNLFKWAIPGGGIVSSANAQFDSSTSHSGIGSMKLSTLDVTGTAIVATALSNATLNATDAIPCSPNTSYTLTGWVKTNNVATNAAYIELRQFAGDYTNATLTASNKLSGTNDWTQVTLTVTTGATTRFLSVVLRNFVAGNIGQAYFDDISLTETVPVGRGMVQDFKSSFLASSATNITNAAITGLSTSAMSFGGWYKVATGQPSSFPHLIAVGGGDSACIFISPTSRNVQGKFNNIGGSAISANFGVIDAGWHHMAVTYDGSSMVLYLDGKVVSTTARTGAITFTNSTMFVANDASANKMAGSLAQQFVYSRSLSIAEIQAIYTAGILPTSGQVLIWQLQEGAGSTALDTSGNANNGTISSATYSADVPSTKRKIVGGNLVSNGDFEYSPPSGSNVSQTSSAGNWIDGTAAGSASNAIFGWAIFASTASSTWSAQFDTASPRSGSYSLRLSTTAIAANVEAANIRNATAATVQQYAIPVLPSTSYSYSFWMKTQVNSGAAISGAYVQFRERLASGSSAGANNPSTKVNTTTGWTQYTGTFTTASTTRYVAIDPTITAADGTGTLIMDAWFDDIVFTPTVNTTRTLA